MFESERTLFIVPHPDDEAFFWGGTIAKLTYERGTQVFLYILSDAEKGRISYQCGRPEIQIRSVHGDETRWYRQERINESFRAARVLGIQSENIHLGHYPNCEFDQNICRGILEEIVRVNPQVVVGFSEAGITRVNNPDHSWSGVAALSVVRALLKNMANTGDLSLALRRYYSYHSLAAIRLFDNKADYKIDGRVGEKINITSQMETKIKACQRYWTQAHLYEYFSGVGFLKDPEETYLLRASIEDGKYFQSDFPLPSYDLITNETGFGGVIGQRCNEAEEESNKLVDLLISGLLRI